MMDPSTPNLDQPSTNYTTKSPINNQSDSIDQSPGALFVFALISDLAIGLLGLVGSLFVMIVMCSHKSLRTPCFQLITGGSFGSILVASYYFGRGIDKIGELTGTMLDLERTVLVCLLTTGVQALFGIPYHALITCLVGMDRIISLLVPIKYRTFGGRYVIYMLCVAFVLILIQEVVGFVSAPLSDVITMCRDFPEALHPRFIEFFAATNLAYCTAIVAIYGAMLIIFIVRKRRSRKQTSEFNMFMKQQSAAMPTVMLMTVLYFLFGIVAEILINVAVNFDPNEYYWVDAVMVAGDFLKAMSSLVEIISLSICSQKFRDRARQMLGVNEESAVTMITRTASHSMMP